MKNTDFSALKRLSDGEEEFISLSQSEAMNRSWLPASQALIRTIPCNVRNESHNEKYAGDLS